MKHEMKFNNTAAMQMRIQIQYCEFYRLLQTFPVQTNCEIHWMKSFSRFLVHKTIIAASNRVCVIPKTISIKFHIWVCYCWFSIEWPSICVESETHTLCTKKNSTFIVDGGKFTASNKRTRKMLKKYLKTNSFFIIVKMCEGEFAEQKIGIYNVYSFNICYETFNSYNFSIDMNQIKASSLLIRV